MLSDKQRGILRDIIHQMELAERFIENRDLESFERDELHLYAVTRCLEIISEASRRLPDELKARHPSIEWKRRNPRAPRGFWPSSPEISRAMLERYAKPKP